MVGRACRPPTLVCEWALLLRHSCVGVCGVQILWQRLRDCSPLAAEGYLMPVVDVMCRWALEGPLLRAACDSLHASLAADDGTDSATPAVPTTAGKRARAVAAAAPTDPSVAMHAGVALRCIEAVFGGNAGGARERLLAGSGHKDVLGVERTLTACRDALVDRVQWGAAGAGLATATLCAGATRTLAKLHLHMAACRGHDSLAPTEGMQAQMVRPRRPPFPPPAGTVPAHCVSRRRGRDTCSVTARTLASVNAMVQKAVRVTYGSRFARGTRSRVAFALRVSCCCRRVSLLPLQTWVVDTAVPALVAASQPSSLGGSRPSKTSAAAATSLASTARRVRVRALYDAACFVVGTVGDCVAAGGVHASCTEFMVHVADILSGAGAAAVGHMLQEPPPHVSAGIVFGGAGGEGVSEDPAADRRARLHASAASHMGVQAARLALHTLVAAHSPLRASPDATVVEAAVQALARVAVGQPSGSSLPVTWTAEESAGEDVSPAVAVIVAGVVDHAAKHGYLQVQRWHLAAPPAAVGACGCLPWAGSRLPTTARVRTRTHARSCGSVLVTICVNLRVAARAQVLSDAFVDRLVSLAVDDAVAAPDAEDLAPLAQTLFTAFMAKCPQVRCRGQGGGVGKGRAGGILPLSTNSPAGHASPCLFVPGLWTASRRRW
jgi:hypothetical protein